MHRTLYIGDLDNLESLDEAKKFFVGLVRQPPTLAEALNGAGIKNYELRSSSNEFAQSAMEDPEIKALGLTDDEAGAISSYTLQLESSKSVYEIINKSLACSRDRNSLMDTRKLIFLFLSGLRKLRRFKPKAGQALYRGFKARVPTTEAEANGHQYYASGRTVTWWGFTSTTTDSSVTNSFTRSDTASTLFSIGGADLWGYDISPFSPYERESEILLEPEAKIVVGSIMSFWTSIMVYVELQPFSHLVLDEIIPVGGIKSLAEKRTVTAGVPKWKFPNEFPLTEDSQAGESLASFSTTQKAQAPIKKAAPPRFASQSVIFTLSQTTHCAPFDCRQESLPCGQPMPKQQQQQQQQQRQQQPPIPTVYKEPSTIEEAVTLLKCANEPENCNVILKKLKEMERKDSDSKTKIRRAGGIEAVIKAIKAYMSNVSVCINGCAVLLSVTQNNPKNKTRSGTAGGIEVVVEAIKTHIDNPDACKNGCGAIMNMTLNNTENQRRAGVAGGIEAIVKAMTTHIDNADVCQRGCDENKAKAGATEMIKVVVKAMDTHTDSNGVCIAGCGVLRNMVTNNAENQEKVGMEGGVETVLKVIDTHINDLMTCKQGCETLLSLMSDYSNNDTARDFGAINTTQKVVEKHPKLKDVTDRIFDSFKKASEAKEIPGVPYRAIFDFTAVKEGDLSFKKGDIIYITNTDSDWWEGMCNDGTIGNVPSNFLASV